jgi:tetratricopeptide (TPR) repeat protein
MVVCALLILIVLAIYLPIMDLRFVNFDDTIYVTQNPRVPDGLSWNSVVWALKTGHAGNWHPLTWISHMVDCQLYGLNPLGHHLTNLFFHTANTLLIFLLLRRTTGAVWRCVFVAALFALHPVHVESVAWVAERKDVLSTFFGLLCLWAYVGYVEKSKARHHAAVFYILTLFLFTLGLLSKPMLVTWPCVMMLLDYWPLRRIQLSDLNSQLPIIRRLLLEKIPFIALSAATCVATFIAQRAGGAVAPLEDVTIESRLINALVSYATYLGKLFWPRNLAVIYPFVRDWPVWRVMVAGLLLLAITGAVIWQGRRRGYLLAGWLWYLVTLVPVIGLVQVGNQSIADRYTYIPSIGLFILFAWGIVDLTAGWSRRALPMTTGAAVLLSGCAILTAFQLRQWEDTETLFRHALAVTENNFVAENNLGFYFALQGELELAKQHYRSALKMNPNYHNAWNNLGCALSDQKKYEEAVSNFEMALRTKPRSADAQNNLGNALFWLGKTNEAMDHYQEALRIKPQYALGHNNLGHALSERGDVTEAIEHFRLAVQFDPRYVDAHCNLAQALVKQGKLDEAMAEYARALAIDPESLLVHYQLGEALVEQKKFDEAISQFTHVLRIRPDYGPARLQLGLIRGMQGRLDEAIALFRENLRTQPDDYAAHYQLALALSGQGKSKEAIQHYEATLKGLPDMPEVLNNLAWIFAANPDSEVRHGAEAVRLAERACNLTQYKQVLMVGTLAAAYAEAGRFADAVATAEKAATLAEQTNELELAAKNRKLMELFRSGKPFHE